MLVVVLGVLKAFKFFPSKLKTRPIPGIGKLRLARYFSVKDNRGFPFFYKLILFCRVYLGNQRIFNCLIKFQVTFQILAVKVGELKRSLMEGKTEKEKKTI